MGDVLLDLLITLGSLVLIFGITIIIHELGHLLAGLLQGFKFMLFVIGPIGICRNKNNRLELYLEKNLGLWGGACAVVPVVNDETTVKKFSTALLGGPIFSISIGFLLMSNLFRQNLFLNAIGMMSLIIGMFCLIPMKNGPGAYTDGGKVIRLYRKKTQKIEMATLNLTIQWMANQMNAVNINPRDFQFLMNEPDPNAKTVGYYFQCLYYQDNQEEKKYQDAKNAFIELDVEMSIKKLYMADLK